jgi:quinol monooxygenase YgiN
MPTLAGSRPDAPSGSHVRFTRHLPLRSRRYAISFLRDAIRLDRLLTRLLADPDSGLVSYELQAQPLRNSYRTISTWTSHEALDAFARHPTHVAIMRRHRDHLGAATFDTSTSDASTSDTSTSDTGRL